MPSPFKSKKTKPAKTKGSAIDAAQRALLEQQNKVQAEIDALQRRIEAEQAARPATGPRRPGSGATPSGQYVHGVTLSELRRPPGVGVGTGTEWPRRRGPRRPTMLREERKAARRQTMALIMLVVGAAIYALYHLLPALYALRHMLP